MSFTTRAYSVKEKILAKHNSCLWASGKGILKHLSPPSLSDSFISGGRAWDGVYDTTGTLVKVSQESQLTGRQI